MSPRLILSNISDCCPCETFTEIVQKTRVWREMSGSTFNDDNINEKCLRSVEYVIKWLILHNIFFAIDIITCLQSDGLELNSEDGENSILVTPSVWTYITRVYWNKIQACWCQCINDENRLTVCHLVDFESFQFLCSFLRSQCLLWIPRF